MLSMPSWSVMSWPMRRWLDGGLDVLDCFQSPLAEVALFVAIAEFDGLVGAGAGAAWHRCAADDAGTELDIDFHSRVAPAVENFTGEDFLDLRVFHRFPWISLKCRPEIQFDDGICRTVGKARFFGREASR